MAPHAAVSALQKEPLRSELLGKQDAYAVADDVNQIKRIRRHACRIARCAKAERAVSRLRATPDFDTSINRDVLELCVTGHPHIDAADSRIVVSAKRQTAQVYGDRRGRGSTIQHPGRR